MRRIETLMQIQNSDFVRPTLESWSTHADKYYDMMWSAFFNSFGPEDKQQGFKFRASNLGNSPFMLAYDYFHPQDAWVPSWSKSFKLHTGFIFETFVAYMLDRMGYTYNYQGEVSTKHGDLEIGGHPDFMDVECGGESKLVIETKCVGDKVFAEYRKAGYVTNWKYVCQLAYYALTTHSEGAFLVGNVDTGELAYFPLDTDMLLNKVQPHLMSNMSNINFIMSCNEWWQTLERIAPPVPKKRIDGTYYLTPDMYIAKGVLHPSTCIYNIEEEGDKKVVTGYNYPEAAKQWEPTL